MNNEAPIFSDELESFFDSEQLPEDALNLVEAHGFLTALNLAPKPITEDVWLAEIFDGEVSWKAGQQESIEKALAELKNSIHRTLYADTELDLPMDLYIDGELDDSEIRQWCIGFLAALFIDEESWYEKDEQSASELLLPFLVLSGLFEDESEEFADMADDDALIEDMCNQLPQVLTELFLLYQAPEEKPAFKGPAKGAKKKR